MAYRKIVSTDAPKRSRLAVSKFERAEDWSLMRADISKGIKRNEALQLVLSAEDKRTLGIKNRRTVARFIKKYLQQRNLPYIMKSFHRDDLGDVFIVQCPPRRR